MWTCRIGPDEVFAQWYAQGLRIFFEIILGQGMLFPVFIFLSPDGVVVELGRMPIY